MKDWFADWFNSPYYHILYKNRDYKEAEIFISNLVKHLTPTDQSRFLDLACGKGRHSIFLNSLGYDVTGVDLSENSIAYAKQFENNRLHFFTHDMRKPIKNDKFNYILNLFTSFGYFETEEDNQKTISAMAASLEKGGKIIIDFFNAHKVIACMVHTETKSIDGIDFHISKRLENGYIIKQIEFSDTGKAYRFYEKVQALKLSDFQKYFSRAGLGITAQYGNYLLHEFDEKQSDRLIFVAELV